jgi:hypothetical protein
MVMRSKSTIEEAVTVEREAEPWEPSIREAVRSAHEQGRVPVVVVYGWTFLQAAESDEFAALAREAVNSRNGSRSGSPVNSSDPERTAVAI